MYSALAVIVFQARLEPTISTHDSRASHDFSSTLGGHLKSLNLFKTQHNVALKRLAAGVQVPPWPPCFQ